MMLQHAQPREIRLDGSPAKGPPSEVLIFPFSNAIRTLKGTFRFTKKSARLVAEQWSRLGRQFGFDFEHDLFSDTLPGSHKVAAGWGDLEVRTSGLWVVRVTWTPDAARKVASKEFRYTSPAFTTTKDGEIVAVLNCALTNSPATLDARPLVASSLPVAGPPGLEDSQVAPKWGTLGGVVLRAGQAENLNTVLVMGGTGGLCAPIQAKMYDNLHSVSLVVGEVLSDAGEVLSPTSSTDVLGQTLPQWPRLSDEPQHLLDTLCDALTTDQQTVVWRTLADGSVFFGADQWTSPDPSYTDQSTGSQLPSYTLLSTAPAMGNLQVIMPVSIAVFPGMTFLGGKVGGTRVIDDGHQFVQRIYYFDQAAGPGDDDPITAGFRAICTEQLRATTYHPSFTGVVVTQHSDGTLDIIMDDVRLPGLTHIPYRVTYPGCVMSIPAGARVRIEFEAGDPRRGSASVYEPGSGAREVVLTGDEADSGTVSISTTSAAPPGKPNGTLTIAYTDQFGVVATPIVLTIPGMTAAPGTMTIPIRGKVTGSAPLKFP